MIKLLKSRVHEDILYAKLLLLARHLNYFYYSKEELETLLLDRACNRPESDFNSSTPRQWYNSLIKKVCTDIRYHCSVGWLFKTEVPLGKDGEGITNNLHSQLLEKSLLNLIGVNANYFFKFSNYDLKEGEHKDYYLDDYLGVEYKFDGQELCLTLWVKDGHPTILSNPWEGALPTSYFTVKLSILRTLLPTLGLYTSLHTESEDANLRGGGGTLYYVYKHITLKN